MVPKEKGNLFYPCAVLSCLLVALNWHTFSQLHSR